MDALIKKRKYFIHHWQLYLFMILPLTYIIIFRYIPMYGAQIAFKDFDGSLGITGGPWVGFKHFEEFIKSYNFWAIVKNTVGISIYRLIADFPFPIILAIALNEIARMKFKKLVQFVTYWPYFISIVVAVSILIQVLSPSIGVVNNFIALLGGQKTNFMAVPGLFKSLYVWSDIWKNTGFGSIIFLAALTGIDQELRQAAVVDGATRLQRIWHIDIPHIMPTAIILLILNVGRIMNVDFEKVYLMQNPLNLSASETISTYVYKLGITRADFSYSAAIDLFNSVINFILLITVNQVSKKFNETSLW